MSEDKNRPATIGDVEEIVTATEERLIEAMRAGRLSCSADLRPSHRCKQSGCVKSKSINPI